MVDIFWFSPERKFVDAPLTNEKASELSHRLRRGYLARAEKVVLIVVFGI